MIIHLLMSLNAALSHVSTPETHTLRSAAEQKLIQYQADYNPGSTHYTAPVRLSVTNTSGRVIQIKIPAGYLFEPNDSQIQPQIVVKEELLALAPGQNKTLALHAFCTNAGKSGPQTGVRYRLAPEVKAPLRELAELISREKYHGFEGQSAVWCYTNNRRIAEIIGADSLKVKHLREQTAKITGKPMPTAEELAGYMANYFAPVQNPLVRISGKYQFEFSKTSNIAIAMFNRNNVVVRELYRNAETPPGKHEVTYEFDNSVYTEDYYKILLIANGKVLLKREMDMTKYRRG